MKPKIRAPYFEIGTKNYIYRHPGPIHAQFGRYVKEPGNYTSMNTDGHLRSVFFGRSETMTIKDGKLL